MAPKRRLSSEQNSNKIRNAGYICKNDNSLTSTKMFVPQHYICSSRTKPFNSAVEISKYRPGSCEISRKLIQNLCNSRTKRNIRTRLQCSSLLRSISTVYLECTNCPNSLSERLGLSILRKISLEENQSVIVGQSLLAALADLPATTIQ